MLTSFISNPSWPYFSTSSLLINFPFSYIAIAPDGLLCQARDEGGWQGARANVGALRGIFSPPLPPPHLLLLLILLHSFHLYIKSCFFLFNSSYLSLSHRPNFAPCLPILTTNNPSVHLCLGKHYYEVEVTDEGLCRVGWSTANASLELGVDKHGFGFGGTGKKSFAKQFDAYGEPFGLKDIVGCFIDLDEMTVAWRCAKI